MAWTNRGRPSDGVKGVLKHLLDAIPSPSVGLEDIKVRRSVQAQITNRDAFNRQVGSHPRGQRRWELIVEPERHAATIG
jgi:hypothetical protein